MSVSRRTLWIVLAVAIALVLLVYLLSQSLVAGEGGSGIEIGPVTTGR